MCGAVADSFDKGTELLRDAAGIRLSESTVQRTTEAVGERMARHLQKGRLIGGKQAWDWFRDAVGGTVGYIAIDATGVRQQGPRGAKAEGRTVLYVTHDSDAMGGADAVFHVDGRVRVGFAAHEHGAAT